MDYAEQYRRYKPAKLKANRAWAARNPEKVKEYRRRTQQKRTANGKNKITSDRWYALHRDRALLYAARKRAQAYGLTFSITIKDVEIPSVCPLLGIPIELDKRARMNPSSPSLDRVDNTKGYVPGNVRVISWKANRMKSDASPEELLTFASNIKAYLNWGL